MTERIAGQSIGNWQTTRHNLPAQLTTLIGREREVAVVRALLQRPEVHLVTLTGTGGVGKTRLGLQIAAELFIELAAARIKLLPPLALLTRLEHRLHLLTGGARDLPVRQQTLRNTIAWSYQLLDTQEQRLFRRLSVFVGGCTLDAVEAVCYETQQEALSALDETASLLDKSLLQHVAQEGSTRLMMLETIREYGLECLRESGEARQIQSAHAEYYLALVEEAEPNLKGAQQLVWLRQLDREQENLRAALGRLIAHEEVEMALPFCAALWWYWRRRGYWSEGRRWLKAVLALSGAGEQMEMRARALSAAGELAAIQFDGQVAFLLLSESVALYRGMGDDRGLVFPLAILGWVLVRQGDSAAGVHLMEESIALCHKLGCTWELSYALLRLGYHAWHQGDLERAREFFTEGLSKAQEFGNETLNTEGLYWELARESLIGWHLMGLARVAVAQNQLIRAARLFAAACAEGRAMTLEQILAEPEPDSMPESDPLVNAQPTIDEPPPTTIHPNDLTAREVEVLRLVAQGSTNEQVAEQLVISPRTVNSHLTSIYSKIRVSTRSAATRYAIEHQLV